MKRFNTVFAAVVVAATLAAVPLANAQNVKYIGAGSSAMFQGISVAALNDLANQIATGAAPAPYNYCTVASGDTCTVGHWSQKTGNAPGHWAGMIDSRAAIPEEFGNIFITWVNCTGAGCPAYTGANGATEVWAYLSVDSTVGVRAFLSRDAAGNPVTLDINPVDTSTPGANAISQKLFVAPWNTSEATVNLQADVATALTGAPITAGMTDIRPEDALLATERLLGNCVGVTCGNLAGPPPFTPPTNACPASDTGVPGAPAPICTQGFGAPYFYSFSLGYGAFPGPGTQLSEAAIGGNGAAKATPVGFALPGFNDPFTGKTVPSTIKVFPVGEAPIILIANRTNANGLGQVIGSYPLCGTPGTDTVVCTSDAAFASDGSYLVRNLWDQHPYPPVANTFPSITFPAVGYCANPANQGLPQCKITRRPLGNLFAGNFCRAASTAFTWPLDPALEGTRNTVPLGDFPVNLVLREPLSGTYNVFEYDEVRRFGGPLGNHTITGTSYGKPPFISEEENIQISAGAQFNPEGFECTHGAGDPGPDGLRYRAVGTGDVVNAVKATADTIGYLFFSFGNVSKIAQNATGNSYGYLMINGIDPLFVDYQDSAGNPGQPAVLAQPLTWGDLPFCNPGGVPDCTANAIWNGSLSYPHLRDGTYPAWSELRLICDTADTRCQTSTDAMGAEALLQNLQVDIHNSNLGGVPDLLPFDDGKKWTVSGYGDVGYIRDHFSFIPADDTQEFNSGPNNLYNANTATGGGPQTTHQALIAAGAGLPLTTAPTCAGATVGVNGPPSSECGGDVGGFVYVVGTANKGGQLQ